MSLFNCGANISLQRRKNIVMATTAKTIACLLTGLVAGRPAPTSLLSTTALLPTSYRPPISSNIHCLFNLHHDRRLNGRRGRPARWRARLVRVAGIRRRGDSLQRPRPTGRDLRATPRLLRLLRAGASHLASALRQHLCHTRFSLPPPIIPPPFATGHALCAQRIPARPGLSTRTLSRLSTCALFFMFAATPMTCRTIHTANAATPTRTWCRGSAAGDTRSVLFHQHTGRMAGMGRSYSTTC